MYKSKFKENCEEQFTILPKEYSSPFFSLFNINNVCNKRKIKSIVITGFNNLYFVTKLNFYQKVSLVVFAKKISSQLVC